MSHSLTLNIRIVTSHGSFTVELYPEQAPMVVKHFLRYAWNRIYDNNPIRRVTDHFAIQGSELESGLIKKPTCARIRKEAERALSNTRGTIAMSRSPDVSYAYPILFINVKDNPELDAFNKRDQGWHYCAFGKIIDGIDVLDRIAGADNANEKTLRDRQNRGTDMQALQILCPDRSHFQTDQVKDRRMSPAALKDKPVVKWIQLPIAGAPVPSTGRRGELGASFVHNSKSTAQDPLLLHAATPDEFLPTRTGWARIGGLALFFVFVGTFLLAAMLDYRVTVDAHATVRPVGELRVVEATSDGTVQSIQVKQNEQVDQGSIIARIDDSRLKAKQAQVRGAITSGIEQLEQLSAQMQALDRQIEAEKDLLSRDLSAAESGLNLTHRQHQEKTEKAKAEVKEALAYLDFAREEYERYAALAPQGAVSDLELKKRESNLRSAEARLAQARSTLDPSEAEIEIAGDAILQVKARREAMLAKFSKEREILLQKQVEIQSKLDANRVELEQLDTEIELSSIKAPVSGVIQMLMLRNPGQVVSAGELVARISPRDNLMEVKTLVALRDIGKVEIGQTVHVRLSACPYSDYGTLQGAVTAISPDAVAPVKVDAASPFNQSAWTGYEVTVQPDSFTLQLSGRKCLIQSGMEGRAEILTKKQTILRFFLGKTRLMAEV